MSRAHRMDPITEFCTDCGASAVEIVDGQRLECRGATDERGKPIPFRTYGVPGGATLREIFFR